MCVTLVPYILPGMHPGFTEWVKPFTHTTSTLPLDHIRFTEWPLRFSTNKCVCMVFIWRRSDRLYLWRICVVQVHLWKYIYLCIYIYIYLYYYILNGNMYIFHLMFNMLKFMRLIDCMYERLYRYIFLLYPNIFFFYEIDSRECRRQLSVQVIGWGGFD